MNRLSLLFLLGILISGFVACDNQTTTEGSEKANPELEKSSLSFIDSLNLQIQEQPDNALLYNNRAAFFLIVGDKNHALADVNKALQLDTLNPDIWVTLADVYFASERFVDSREVLLKAIKMDPENTAGLLKLARLYIIYREYNTTLAYVDKALEVDPLLKDAYFLKGLTYAEKGDTSSSVFFYQKAVEVAPDFYDAWIELGIIYEAKENTLAEQYYKNALELDTNNTHALYILALYYQETGSYNQAEEAYHSILNKEENKNAWFNLGYINLVYFENYPDAISNFQRALNIAPDYHDALFNLAFALELSGDKEDARVKYKELLQRVPNHEAAVLQLNKLD